MKNLTHILACLFIAIYQPLSAQSNLIDTKVVISEIFYDTPYNEQIGLGEPYSNGEFIELYNTESDDVNIGGWSVTGGGKTETYIFPANTILKARGYIVLAYRYNSDFTFYKQATPPNKQLIYQRKIILSNSGETVSLLDKQNIVRDHIYYDGNSNKTKKDRLSADNVDTELMEDCFSLHRINMAFDLEGNGIFDNAHWVTECLSPFALHNALDDKSDIGLFSGNNYVFTRTYQDKDAQRSIVNIQYYDGLGYPEELVQHKVTPDHKDLTTLQDYDLIQSQDKDMVTSRS